MRSALIVLGGLVLLGVMALIGWRVGGGTQAMPTVAKIFIPVWLVIALVNMWMGVARAGYSVVEELPVFLAIFVVPAAVASFVWWKTS